MRPIGLAVVLLVIASPVHGEDRRSTTRFTVTAATLAALAVIDIRQSTPCLHSATCAEVNPLYRRTSMAGFVAVKTAATAGVIAGAWQLRKKHPKAAWTLLGVTTAAQGFAVAWNARQLRGRP